MRSEEIEQHPVWEALADARQKLTNLGQGSVQAEIGTVSDLINGLSLGETLKTSAAIFINAESFDQLRALAESIGNTVVAGMENDEEVSEQLNDHLNKLADTLGGLPINTANASVLHEYEIAMRGFVSNLSSITGRLNEIQSESEGILEKYQSQIDQRQESIESEFSIRHEALTAKIASAQEAISAVKVDIESQKTRLDTALNEFSTNSAEQSRRVDDDFKKLKTKFEIDFAVQQDELGEVASEIMAKLQAHKDQAEELVDASARGTISADYGSRAAEERKAALTWSIFAVFVAVIGLAIITWGITNIGDMGPSETIWKSSVTIVLLAVAGYMGKEAAGHRKEERDAKRAQLDLNSFNPFLTLMDEDDARELRKEFAQRIFNRPLANLKTESGFGFVSPLQRRGKQEKLEIVDE